MRITFLGTGSAMPTGTRMQTGTLVERGPDASDRLLLDCGSGVLHALARTDTGYAGIDTVLLSHHHLDHVSDLLVLMKARWLAGETDLEVVGPPGTTALVGDLLAAHDYMQDRLELTLRDITAGEDVTVAGFDVSSMETRHSMDCHAYRLTHPSAPETTFVHSGDSEAFTDLIEFADGAAVLAHDCSFPDQVDVSNHPTPTQLGETLAAADADVGRVYLTHLYPHTEDSHEAMLAAIDEHYDGDVRFAEDSLTVDLSKAT